MFAVIRRSSRSLSENKLGDSFLVLDVRLCNGKLVTIAVTERGFYSCSKQHLQEHSLVALLRSLSKAFAKVTKTSNQGFRALASDSHDLYFKVNSIPDKELLCIVLQAYDDLMRALLERNRVRHNIVIDCDAPACLFSWV